MSSQTSSTTEYEFIIVGSGPAGCALASKLARTNSRPKVLLIEAGKDYPVKNIPHGQRWGAFQNPEINCGYKTVPQEQCYGRQIDYSRGMCLGGSTAINFATYSIGCRDDFEEWADIVGDDHFGWDNMKRRFKDLETLHDAVPADMNGRKYAAPNLANHGSSSPLHVGFVSEWERDLPSMMEAFVQAGYDINPDHNSGHPLGISISIKTVRKGVVSSAEDLILNAPENLTVKVNSPVQRLLYDQKRVIGVESNGQRYLASKEMMLSAGAPNTPQILMHSGIGPATQLAKFGIPIVLENNAVGQGLRDHSFFSIVLKRKEGSTDRKSFYGDQKAMEAAQKQWETERTGPWTVFGYESAIDFPSDHPDCVTLNGFLFNAQSRGQVTLQSSDPSVPLLFDPKVLDHPFDRRMAIITLRSLLRVANHPNFKKDTIGVLTGLVSESDEDLLEYCKRSVVSTWHMCGTAKMGAKQDGISVVGPDFSV
ncbi:hypothetical protein J3E72DRAFT_440718 [Bipolaris maydis]|nr:hypothetical protein J3E72DRAFT_440718 [Bipolaris maydis]